MPRKKAPARKKYTQEFKINAVKEMINRNGEGTSEVAERLGIAPNMLYTWKKKFQPHVKAEIKAVKKSEKEAGSLQEARAEIARLKIQVESLQEEKASLLKTTKMIIKSSEI